jgi:hypothetical protein
MLNLDISKYDSAEAALKNYAYKHGFVSTVTSEGYGYSYQEGDVSKLLADLESKSTYTSSIETLMAKYVGGTDAEGNPIKGLYETWFSGSGKNIYESMNQSTMKDFYNRLDYIYETEGKDAG